MTPYSKNIDTETLNALELKHFEGKITVIENEEDVEDAVKFLKQCPFLGFDTETRPSFKKGKTNQVALLQLSTEKKAFLFRLNKIGGLPKELADLLSDKRVRKIGVAIKDDIKGLQKLRPFKAQNFIELQNYVRCFAIDVSGLKKICAIVLGFRISKAQQLSNWEEDTLSLAQQIYAATDAWCGIMIYKKLLNTKFEMNNQLIDKVQNKFTELFSNNPMLVRAPGRINLIGEHTDYNNGFVLPCAVSPAIYFAIKKRDDNYVNLVSIDFNDKCKFNLDKDQKPKQQWANYLYGICKIIQKEKEINGFDCVFGGDVPLGAGMSSSAALESGLALALNEIFKLNLPKMRLAEIGQASEHQYVGVKCGIMDQFASIFGEHGKCVRLDCRSLEYEYSRLNLKDCVFVLTDTKVKHSLASSEYNTRREECAKAVEIISSKYPEVKSLRDSNLQQIESLKDKMSENVYNRAKYVVEENNRVIEACNALNSDDLVRFGKLLYGSHEGLSKLYQVSCDELDFLVEQTKNMDYVLGSRMMGGGFGGCTLSLIKKDKLEEYQNIIAPIYKEKFNLNCQFYIATAENGAEVII